MVFKHYAFDQYPYGANILVKSIESSISTKIGLERIDFITSSNEPVSMTYNYEEINGTLVSISTNLVFTLNKKNHTFTLSNSNIFGDSTKKPYIHLLCNDVKVPISFFTSGTIGNKWYSLAETTDQIKLLDGYPDNPGRLCIPREITVGWNKSYTIQLFTNESGLSSGTGEFCRVDISYGYLDNNNKFATERKIIFISNIHTTITNGNNSKITIPPLNGTQNIIEGINHQASGQTETNKKISITRKFYKYFRLGFLVRLDNGYGKWEGDTAFYIENTNKIYHSNRIDVNTLTGKYYLESDGFPILNTSFSDNWNTDFFYTIDNNENMNISPSSSEIKVEYSFQQTGADDYKGVCGDDYWGCCEDSCTNQGCTNQGCTNQGCTSDGCTNQGCTSDGCTNQGCTSDGCTSDGCTSDGCTSDGCTNQEECPPDGCTNQGCTNQDSDENPYYSSINIPLRTYAAVWVHFDSVNEDVLVGTYVRGTYDGYWDGYSSEATIYGDFVVSGTSSNGTNCVTGVDALSVVDFEASGLTCD